MRPQWLGQYKLLERIGVDMDASVWLARREDAPVEEAPVVLYHFLERMSREEHFRNALELNAPVLCSLQHPHLPRWREVHVSETWCFAVANTPTGSPLLQEVRYKRRAPPLEPLRAARLISELCSAIEYARYFYDPHTGRSLYWRHDFLASSARIVNEKALYLDFMTPRWRRGATDSNHLLGLIAPEKIQTETTDARSEVFSLGGLLYELLTAARPFPGRQLIDTLNQILNSSPAHPKTLVPNLPEALCHITMRALERDAKHRYPTPGELGRALRSMLEETDQSFETMTIERATDWLRAHLYENDHHAVRTLLDIRPELAQVPVLADYIWGHLEEPLMRVVLRPGPTSKWVWRALLALPNARPALEKLLRNPETPEHARVMAVQLLGASKAPQIRDALVGALRDTSAQVRHEALGALSLLPAPPSPHLHTHHSTPCLTKYRSTNVRMRLGSAVWSIQPRQPILLGSEPNAPLCHSSLRAKHATLTNPGDGTLIVRALEGPVYVEGVEIEVFALDPAQAHSISLGTLRLEAGGGWIEVYGMHLTDVSLAQIPLQTQLHHTAQRAKNSPDEPHFWERARRILSRNNKPVDHEE